MKKHILNNGGEHDGEECTYTMCWSNDPKVKSKCLGWCTVTDKKINNTLMKKEKSETFADQLINRLSAIRKEDDFYFRTYGVEFANEIINPLQSQLVEKNLELGALRVECSELRDICNIADKIIKRKHDDGDMEFYIQLRSRVGGFK